jgi:methionyl-tRNA synthetase
MSNKVFYITTPIYYVNAAPHIGHVFSTLIADCLARYHKLSGKEVFFVTGTDEHGQKVEQKAKSFDKTPQQFTNEVSQVFKDCFQKLGFEYDRFIRTTDPDHIEEVKKMWTLLEQNGDIYLGNYEGWYSVSDETFVQDFNVIDGIDPATNEPCKVFKETGNKVVRAKEENFMFRLSKYKDQILEWLRKSPIVPESRNQEMIHYVENDLRDLSISRKKTVTEWGIEIPNNKDDVVYVWLDALTNYKTAANNNAGKNIFPADIHIVGKDILKFHAVYWIGFLLSAKLPLPSKIFAHGWWMVDGERMSKTRGNVIHPMEIAPKYGNDVLRYVLLRESSCGHDSEFTEDVMISRLNSDLAQNFGNLVMRCLGAKIHPDGKVPPRPDFKLFSDQDKKIMEKFLVTTKKCNMYMQIPDIQNYLVTVWEFIHELNKYINEEKPWKLVKENPERSNIVRYNMLEYLRTVTIMVSPILVDTSKKILEYLGVDKDGPTDGLLKEGQEIKTNVPILFERMDVKDC